MSALSSVSARSLPDQETVRTVSAKAILTGGVWLVACLHAVVLSAATPIEDAVASIGVRPAYASGNRLGVDAALRGIAFSPALPASARPERKQGSDRYALRATWANNAAPSFETDGPVGLAVGDAGVVLRSLDLGNTWHRVAIPLDSRSAANITLHDVVWLSSRDAIVVGGGFEPLTGFSRAVCLQTQDRGQSWRLIDTTDVPRMTRLRAGPAPATEHDEELAAGVIEASVDDSSMTRSFRFHSFDGGQTWHESNRTGTRIRSTTQLIATGQGRQLIHDQSVLNTSAGTQSFAVGPHQSIFRRQPDEPTWQPIHGGSARAAVLVVVSHTNRIPWALITQETLQAGNRVAVVVDQNADHWNVRQLAPAKQAAAMIGVTAMHSRWELPAELTPRELLSVYAGTVLVLDATLDVQRSQAWQEAARVACQEQSRLERPGAESISLASRVFSFDFPSEVSRQPHVLTRLAATDQDITLDAMMVASPGRVPKPRASVNLLWDVSGAPRGREGVAQGLRLSARQKRPDEALADTSHRRLQMTTARLRQDDSFLTRGETYEDLSFQLNQRLTMTAVEDRGRLLWSWVLRLVHDQGMDGRTRRQALASVLTAMGKHARHPVLQRWAGLWRIATQQSLPLVHPSHNSPQAVQPVGYTTTQVLSPFQVSNAAPTHSNKAHSNASHSNHLQAGVAPQTSVVQQTAFESIATMSAPSPRILVPASKPVGWQVAGAGPLAKWSPGVPSLDQVNDRDQELSSVAETTRWQNDAVVMAVNLSASNQEQVDTSRLHQPIELGVTADRPLLDGRLNDRCWSRAVALENNAHVVLGCQDNDYFYFALSQRALPSSTHHRLSLDFQGSFLEAVHFDFDRSGGLASQQGIEIPKPFGASDGPTWFIAASERLIEIAIAKTHPDQDLLRFQYDWVGPRASPPWQPMPHSHRWLSGTNHSSRQRHRRQP